MAMGLEGRFPGSGGDAGPAIGRLEASVVDPRATVVTAGSARDALWERCRSSLAIARLLVREGRPLGLVRAACVTAVETASRAALEQAGLRFEGDAQRALGRLAAPPALGQDVDRSDAREVLAGAESVAEWVAAYLRSEAPERPWGT
jgi:hypothetical protein